MGALLSPAPVIRTGAYTHGVTPTYVHSSSCTRQTATVDGHEVELWHAWAELPGSGDLLPRWEYVWSCTDTPAFPLDWSTDPRDVLPVGEVALEVCACGVLLATEYETCHGCEVERLEAQCDA